MSLHHFIRDFMNRQYVREGIIRAVEGIVVMFLIIVGIAAVCYLASAVFRALGVG